jgi:hypothetical protein
MQETSTGKKEDIYPGIWIKAIDKRRLFDKSYQIIFSIFLL